MTPMRSDVVVKHSNLSAGSALDAAKSAGVISGVDSADVEKLETGTPPLEKWPIPPRAVPNDRQSRHSGRAAHQCRAG